MKIIDKHVILVMVFLSWFGTLSPRTFSVAVAERIVKNGLAELARTKTIKNIADFKTAYQDLSPAQKDNYEDDYQDAVKTIERAGTVQRQQQLQRQREEERKKREWLERERLNKEKNDTFKLELERLKIERDKKEEEEKQKKLEQQLLENKQLFAEIQKEEESEEKELVQKKKQEELLKKAQEQEKEQLQKEEIKRKLEEKQKAEELKKQQQKEEQERQHKERIEKERLRQEKIKQDRLERERLKKEQDEQRLFAKQKLEQEKKRLEEEKKHQQEELYKKQELWLKEKQLLAEIQKEEELKKEEEKKLFALQKLEEEKKQVEQEKKRQEEDKKKLEEQLLRDKQLLAEIKSQEEQIVPSRKDKLEKQRKEQEEKERLEKRKQEDLKRQQEQERLKKEQEEQVRLEKEKLERERLEKEKLEREKLQQEEQEKKRKQQEQDKINLGSITKDGAVIIQQPQSLLRSVLVFSYEDSKNGKTMSTEPSITLNKEKEDLPLPPVKVGLVRKLTLFNGNMLIGQINIEEVRNKQQNKNYPFMVKIEPSQGFSYGGAVSFDIFVSYTMGKNWEKVAFKKEEEKQELQDNENEYLPFLEDEDEINTTPEEKGMTSIEINKLKENLKKCQNNNGVIVHNRSGQGIKIYFYNQKFTTTNTLYRVDNTNVLIENGHSGIMCAPQGATSFNSACFYIIVLGINDNPAPTYDIQNVKKQSFNLSEYKGGNKVIEIQPFK